MSKWLIGGIITVVVVCVILIVLDVTNVIKIPYLHDWLHPSSSSSTSSTSSTTPTSSSSSSGRTPTPDTRIVETRPPDRCPPLRAGTWCDKTIANSCSNNAISISSSSYLVTGQVKEVEDRSGPPMCECKPGFAGIDCSQTLAQVCSAAGTNIVENVRTRSDGGSGPIVVTPKCVCKSGYAGPKCDQTIAQYCNNRATAFRAGSTTVCDCQSPYTGDRCDISSEVRCTAGQSPCQQLTSISDDLEVYKNTSTGKYRSQVKSAPAAACENGNPVTLCKRQGQTEPTDDCNDITDPTEYTFECRPKIKRR